MDAGPKGRDYVSNYFLSFCDGVESNSCTNCYIIMSGIFSN